MLPLLDRKRFSVSILIFPEFPSPSPVPLLTLVEIPLLRDCVISSPKKLLVTLANPSTMIVSEIFRLISPLFAIPATLL